MKRFCLLLFSVVFAVSSFAQQPTEAEIRAREEGLKADAEWIPTGVWPFLNRRFQPAEVITGLFTKKKTVVPCNIHVGSQHLYYMQKDTLMEADAMNVSRVTFPNGDVYVPIGSTFGRIVREDSIGKVVCVRLIDKEKFDESAKDASRMGSFSLGGDFGTLNMDLISSYVANPEEQPLPILDTYYFIYNLEIFEVTDKNILSRINPARKREYQAFTRSAEILSHNESSVLKIWQTFFLKR